MVFRRGGGRGSSSFRPRNRIRNWNRRRTPERGPVKFGSGQPSPAPASGLGQIDVSLANILRSRNRRPLPGNRPPVAAAPSRLPRRAGDRFGIAPTQSGVGQAVRVRRRWRPVPADGKSPVPALGLVTKGGRLESQFGDRKRASGAREPSPAERHPCLGGERTRALIGNDPGR